MSQPQHFPTPARLSDASLLQRLAGAEQVLADEPDLTREQRMELLLLVVAPAVWGAEQ